MMYPRWSYFTLCTYKRKQAHMQCMYIASALSQKKEIQRKEGEWRSIYLRVSIALVGICITWALVKMQD